MPRSVSSAIHWFRQDLRLADNPALRAACAHGAVLPVYILDDSNAGAQAMGSASRWWLHNSLRSLNESLGGKLSLYRATAKVKPQDILLRLAKRHRAQAITWNRCYEPWRTQRDIQIKRHLKQSGLVVETCNGSLLWEPWQVVKADGTPYRVFTPFYRRGCLNAESPRKPFAKPRAPNWLDDPQAQPLEALNLLPSASWHESLTSYWQTGEVEAQTRLKTFLKTGLPHYKGGRDYPAKLCTSRLSPYLHFGELSPHQAWHKACASTFASDEHTDEHTDTFLSQLAWREFSYSLLYYNTDLPHKNLQEKFDKFPWREDEAALLAWQRGQTGVPLIDAGMRELWQTGFMHNRLRMLVGSFLVKNLLLDWRHGERWFWDTLVDADLANNAAGWQWVAGSGADAAPYFRIFNPVVQGQRFDADGDYIRHYVPELSSLPTRYLFAPWQAPPKALEQAGIVLGATYPHPITDLKTSRQTALEAFKSLS